MKIEYYHGSVHGNGAKVAEEFRDIMAANGTNVNVHHVEDVEPDDIPLADLYIFSSPGRFGKPVKSMRKFLTKLRLPSGSRYAILVTEMNPQADRTTGEAPAEKELGKCQRVIPIMDAILEAKGLSKIAEGKVYVTGIKGPLEDRWRSKVEEFAAALRRADQRTAGS
ncbi:MAG: hypothetical protein AB1793_02815 [Candidatus Thermoplasmatota archaeon]